MNKNRTKERLRNNFGNLKEDNFNFKDIETYFRKKDNSGYLQTLSDKTCNDLDFEEVFMYLDRTTSKVGQQFLYNQLRNIPNSSDRIILREKLINELQKDEELITETQLKLEKLKKDDVYNIPALFQGKYAEPPKWFNIAKYLSFSSIMTLILLPFKPQLFLVLIVIFLINFVIHYFNKKNLNQYLGSIPQLIKLKEVSEQLNKTNNFSELNPKLSESIKVMNQIKNKMLFFRLEAKLQSDIEAIIWTILEFFKILFLIEPLLLFSILKQLDSRRKETEEIFCFVGEIDMLISIISLRTGNKNTCIPQITDKTINAKQLYHPLILNHVENDILVNEKSILLTGSNMSGKTTFIRSIGINIITGLTINTCFAENISIPRARIFSAIRISDDLMNDKSYYFEEVLTIKEMIDQSQENSTNVFLLDEIFKGTNTIERISAGKAVLSSLSKNNNIVFVSTHDIELTDMLKDEYDLYHFSEVVKDNNVDFDYKLKTGKLKNRNAIRILQINDYPDEIINEAFDISHKLDKLNQQHTNPTF